MWHDNRRARQTLGLFFPQVLGLDVCRRIVRNDRRGKCSEQVRALRCAVCVCCIRLSDDSYISLSEAVTRPRGLKCSIAKAAKYYTSLALLFISSYVPIFFFSFFFFSKGPLLGLVIERCTQNSLGLQKIAHFPLLFLMRTLNGLNQIPFSVQSLCVRDPITASICKSWTLS